MVCGIPPALDACWWGSRSPGAVPCAGGIEKCTLHSRIYTCESDGHPGQACNMIDCRDDSYLNGGLVRTVLMGSARDLASTTVGDLHRNRTFALNESHGLRGEGARRAHKSQNIITQEGGAVRIPKTPAAMQARCCTSSQLGWMQRATPSVGCVFDGTN